MPLAESVAAAPITGTEAFFAAAGSASAGGGAAGTAARAALFGASFASNLLLS